MAKWNRRINFYDFLDFAATYAGHACNQRRTRIMRILGRSRLELERILF